MFVAACDYSQLGHYNIPAEDRRAARLSDMELSAYFLCRLQAKRWQDYWRPLKR